MQTLRVLNSRDKKRMLDRVNEHFGSSFATDKSLLQDENWNIYLVNPDMANIDFTKLRIDKAGLLFGMIKDDELMLSIEGSQMMGKTAKKNLIELTKDEMMKYLGGESIEKQLKDGNYLLKCGDDFLGTGKVRAGKLLNALPRSRRINK